VQGRAVLDEAPGGGGAVLRPGTLSTNFGDRTLAARCHLFFSLLPPAGCPLPAVIFTPAPSSPAPPRLCSPVPQLGFAFAETARQLEGSAAGIATAVARAEQS